MAFLQKKLVRNGKRYVIYGDPAYGTNDVILSGYKGSRLDTHQAEFNKCMSAVRVSVEWGFGIGINLWRKIDLTGGQKLWSQAVGQQYAVAVLLTNIHTCVKGGNQISDYFGMSPPTITEYLKTKP